MLDYVDDYRTTAFSDRWWLPIRRLLASSGKKAGCGRLPRELAFLSDQVLLDIGVDPRCVPNPAGQLISRPDLARNGLVPPIWRSTPRS